METMTSPSPKELQDDLWGNKIALRELEREHPADQRSADEQAEIEKWTTEIDAKERHIHELGLDKIHVDHEGVVLTPNEVAKNSSEPQPPVSGGGRVND